MESLSCAIDNLGPLPLQQPASVDELQALVRQAGTDGHAVYPLGGRTALGLGMSPARKGVAIDLRCLDKVIDYAARDMTITVGAGITLARLQEIQAAEGQRLPIDVPRAAEATLGGTIATNTSGPRRYGYGTLRDYVIGISVVNDRGEEVKAGGRVVKNVAGYDMCKLYVGSLGTLGVITQVTLKLRPQPEEQALLILSCPAAELAALLDRLHSSRTHPVCLEVLNPAAVRHLNRTATVGLPEAGWVVLAGYESNRAAVTWQTRQLVLELGAGHTLDVRVGAPAAPLWQALVELPATAPEALTFKANVLPSACAGFCLRADALADGLLLQAHAGNGIVVGHVPPGMALESAAAVVRSLREGAAAGNGYVVLPRCPTSWKVPLNVWGPPRGDAWLMRAIKQQLDPRRLFNPGRFVDGI